MKGRIFHQEKAQASSTRQKKTCSNPTQSNKRVPKMQVANSWRQNSMAHLLRKKKRRTWVYVDECHCFLGGDLCSVRSCFWRLDFVGKRYLCCLGSTVSVPRAGVEYLRRTNNYSCRPGLGSRDGDPFPPTHSTLHIHHKNTTHTHAKHPNRITSSQKNQSLRTKST